MFYFIFAVKILEEICNKTTTEMSNWIDKIEKTEEGNFCSQVSDMAQN